MYESEILPLDREIRGRGCGCAQGFDADADADGEGECECEDVVVRVGAMNREVARLSCVPGTGG